MPRAYYMDLIEGHHGALDRAGGLPLHLPPQYPLSSGSGSPMGFLAQFYCDPVRLDLPGLLCIHLYQDVDVDDGGE